MGSRKNIPPARRRAEGLGTNKEQNPGVDREDPNTMDVAVGEDDEWAPWALGFSMWRIPWPPPGHLHSAVDSHLLGPRPPTQTSLLTEPSL